MTRITALAPALTMVFALGLGTAANAADAIPGTWKVAIGHDDTCNVTLQAGTAADYGTVTPASDCGVAIAKIAQWKSTFRGVEFLANNGELLAIVKPQGDAYAGKRIADNRDVELSRTQIGSAH